MKPRVVIAAAIGVAWLGGLGLMVRREVYRPQIERLAEAALRVTPAAVFYAVLQDGRQVGFASSTVQTVALWKIRSAGCATARAPPQRVRARSRVVRTLAEAREGIAIVGTS